jgi:hypothetical protein
MKKIYFTDDLMDTMVFMTFCFFSFSFLLSLLNYVLVDVPFAKLDILVIVSVAYASIYDLDHVIL